MKSIRQIANETGLPYETVYRKVLKEGFLTDRFHGKRMLTIHQEDHIHSILYFSGYFTTLTIESKMNEINYEEEFLEHKRTTYTKNL